MGGILVAVLIWLVLIAMTRSEIEPLTFSGNARHFDASARPWPDMRIDLNSADEAQLDLLCCDVFYLPRSRPFFLKGTSD